MSELFTIESDALSPAPTVVGFRGEEGLSKLSRWEIGLLLEDDEELDLEAPPTAKAALTLHTEPESPDHIVSGILASVEMLHAWGQSTLYRAVLVPTFWKATLTHHSRVFVDRTTPEIIEEVLAASGIESYELRLDASYEANLHVTQYQESNYAFLARLMEREGIYYFFDHTADGDTLIITDTLSSHDALNDSSVAYSPLSDNSAAEANNAFSTFTCRRSMLSADVKLTDYDYLKPSLALEATETIANEGSLVHYGDNFKTNGDGGRLAKVRAEHHLSQQKVFHATGRVFNVKAGYTFTVEGHPRGAMNETYLCTEVFHEGHDGDPKSYAKTLLGIETDHEYYIHATGIPKDVQYRPAQRTPIPRVEGMLHALVDGPADSDYAQLDAEGRYHVRLMLDESTYEDGAASMWVRMIQWHGGGTEGVHFPLRKGTEVLISFIGGDPDRPFLAGAIPNPQKPSPVTSANHTMNILITGGSNYLSMEDQEGSQWIDLSTPSSDTWLHFGKVVNDRTHEIVLNTEANCLFNIGGNQDIEVGGDLYEHVVGDVTELYDADQDSEVAGDQTLEVGCDRDIEVGGDQTVEIGGDFDTEVGGDITLEGGADYDTEISGDITFENGGDFDVEVGGDITWEGGGDHDTEISGDITFENGGDFDVETSGDITFENGGDVAWDCGGNWTQNIAGTHTVNVGVKDFWSFGDEKKGTVGTAFEIFIGGKTEIKVGKFAEIALADKFGLHIGSDISISAADKLEITAGGKILMDASATIQMVGGPFMDMQPIKMDFSGVEIKS